MYCTASKEKWKQNWKMAAIMKLTAGMTYFVGDNNEAHRSSTAVGCKLFIVD